MDKTSKIYVAGHRGLVGSAIWRALEKEGYTNLIGRTSSELDLTDQEAVNALFEAEQPEYVFLAAAKVGGIMANFKYRAEFIYSNLEIQNNVIDACYRYKVKKLLFLGSSCIYPKDAPQPITEDSLLTSPLEYTNEPYAIAKIAGIKMIESYNIQYGTNFLSVMPTNLYGYNDNYDLESAHVFPALIHKTILSKWYSDGNFDAIVKDLQLANADAVPEALAAQGIVKDSDTVTMTLWGDGTPRREFLHADDMADACIFVMNNVNFSDLTKDMGQEIRNTHINIGYDSDISIREYAEMIQELVGYTGQIAFDASKPNGTMKKLMSSAKLHSLGWQHKIELRQGAEQMVAEYLKLSDQETHA